ncbi:acyltransferase family domain-containing protein [Phthorimaea operculella]|nr:acyltransferase family domain-containing protein [Phthorimaea operculella]
MWRLLVLCLSVVAAQNVTEVTENEVQTTTTTSTSTTAEQSQPAQQELQQELDYYSMPALSQLDDFDLCLRRPGAVYCIVDLELMEDDTPLYQYIKNYSTFSYKNYRHSKLHRGVCADQHCGLNLTHVNASEATATALKECFNRSIHQGYGLQVESLSVRYCKTQNDWKPPDALDYIIGNKFMLAFCLQKNWKALKHGGSAEGGLFKCFQAMRFITMVMILGLHSMIFIGYGYTENPEFIEHSYSDFFKALLFNARVIVQIFFVMGGFLMAYKMLVYAETHPFSLKTIPMALVNRWFRLMPAVLVVMGLAMTWVPHMGSGPMWDAVVGREREMCRNNWWQLVILSPNLFPFEYLCLPQAW